MNKTILAFLLVALAAHLAAAEKSRMELLIVKRYDHAATQKNTYVLCYEGSKDFVVKFQVDADGNPATAGTYQDQVKVFLRDVVRLVNHHTYWFHRVTIRYGKRKVSCDLAFHQTGAVSLWVPKKPGGQVALQFVVAERIR